MTDEKQAKTGKPDYGIDAPLVVRNLAIGGLACFLAGLIPVLRGFIISGVFLFAAAGLMLWSSKVGKLLGRERLLDALSLRGDETVLDVGCGRGLMLIGAARRLTSGKAVGVDIWQEVDISGNSAKATWENATIEGVLDRVEICDGDARQLPFPDSSFDLVLSCQAIHNIYNAAEREKAIREIIRVLKPAGRVAIVDFRHTKQYAQVLKDNAFTEVELNWTLFRQFPPTPIVMARKPE